MGSFKAAVVQAAAAGFDLERGLEKVSRLAAEASSGGAALAVFPEAFLPAYPRGIAFGTVVGDRTAEGREQFRRYFEASVDVPGPTVASTRHPSRQSPLPSDLEGLGILTGPPAADMLGVCRPPTDC